MRLASDTTNLHPIEQVGDIWRGHLSACFLGAESLKQKVSNNYDNTWDEWDIHNRGVVVMDLTVLDVEEDYVRAMFTEWNGNNQVRAAQVSESSEHFAVVPNPSTTPNTYIPRSTTWTVCMTHRPGGSFCRRVTLLAWQQTGSRAVQRALSAMMGRTSPATPCATSRAKMAAANSGNMVTHITP